MRLAIEPGAWTTRAVAALESGRLMPISDSASASGDGVASLVVESGGSAAVGHVARFLSAQDAKAPRSSPFDDSALGLDPGSAEGNDPGLSREVAAAILLRRIAQEAESAAGASVDGLVFAVPSARFAKTSPGLLRAAGLAGLPVLDVVEAEIAALLAAAARNRRVRGSVLHLDFGHSATRVSLLRCDPDEIEILAAREDTVHAGSAFLAALRLRLMESLALHVSPLHLRTAVRAPHAMEVLAETWTGLRGTRASAVSVPLEVAGQPYVFCTTRFDLDQLFGGNLAAAQELSALCLRDAATSPDGVDAAVVTGLPFSTAMLQERFAETFPRLADMRRWVVDPGLAAEGTAQHAARLPDGSPAVPVPPELRGVVRSPIFLVLRDAGTGGRRFEKLFDAGQTLPAAVRRQVHLAGRGVDRVVVAIAVGGREAQEPTLVGDLELAVPAEARELGALEIEIVHETSSELVVRGLAGGQAGPRSIALPALSIGQDRLALRRLSWIRQVGFLGSTA